MDNNKVYLMDCVEGMKQLADKSAQIIICDCPYNIGKDFNNNSDKQSMDEYLLWCDKWIEQCLRVLKPNGTMYIYGFSEILAFIRVKLTCNVRWLVWHYTNKNSPTLKFWQRSHESILCCWKDDKVFNLNEVREPYTETFLKSVGKQRKATVGRFSSGDKETTYTAHEKGALPRDVLKTEQIPMDDIIKIPALAGGAGKKERTNHPTQKPIELCLRLLKAAKQNTDDIVVIPFAGSGSECVACQQLGLPFIAFEINHEYVKLCNERLQQENKKDETQPSTSKSASSSNQD